MSFSKDVKMGLARMIPEKKCCELAEIAGFLRVCGKVSEKNGSFELTLSTDNPAVTRHYKRLISDYYKVEPALTITEPGSTVGAKRYVLTIGKDMKSDSILREAGMLLVREGENYITDSIYQDIVRKKCDKRAFLRGVFMASGTVADPAREYHLEFVLTSAVLADDIRKLINSFDDLEAKVTIRREKYVCYIKKSEYIRDILALIGAGTQVMYLENAKIEKEMITRTVRITNCDSANTDRALDAAAEQTKAIRMLIESGKIANLTDKLKEVALLRLDHPEASLSELGEMLEPQLKKSGVNGRLARVMEYAKEIDMTEEILDM